MVTVVQSSVMRQRAPPQVLVFTCKFACIPEAKRADPVRYGSWTSHTCGLNTS
jgi:hypothetical protein